MKILSIRIDEKIEKELEQIASNKNTKKTKLIRKIVEQWVENYNI